MDYYWLSYYIFLFVYFYVIILHCLWVCSGMVMVTLHTPLPYSFPICILMLKFVFSFFFSLFIFLTLTMVCYGMVSFIVHMVLFGYVCKSGFLSLVWCFKINRLCYKPILFLFITHSTPTAHIPTKLIPHHQFISYLYARQSLFPSISFHLFHCSLLVNSYPFF